MFLLAGEQRYFEETLPVSELKDLLDSGSMSSARGQADRIRGLKWLLAMISKGTDVSRFFPDVIRNIMTVNFELKKLAYMYVLHYCDHNEQSRSTALLSINAFQRDLSDESELIRGLSLRTLTSIRVKDILEVQFLAVKTSCRDPSPYVRKISANAVSKLGVRNQFEDSVLGVLIMDSSPSVMGSAAQAILQVCPERYDLVHRAFDRLCLVLHDVDEFGQVALLKLLSRYVRYAFTAPTTSMGATAEEDDARDVAATTMAVRRDPFRGSAATLATKEEENLAVPAKRKLPTKRELESFLDDDNNSATSSSSGEEEEEDKSALPVVVAASSQQPLPLHECHKRLLQLALSLLKSRNSSVVMAAVHTSWYCGQRSTSALRQVAQALVRLIKSPGSREVAYFALQAAVPLVHQRPRVFQVDDFFVLESDLGLVKRRKLELMAFLVQPSSLDKVLAEMERYAQHTNAHFAAQAVKTLGVIVDRQLSLLQSSSSSTASKLASDCLQGLATIVFSGNGGDSSGGKVFPARVREEAIGVARAILARQELGNAAAVPLLPMTKRFLAIPLHNGADEEEEGEDEDDAHHTGTGLGFSLGPQGKMSLLWLARRFHVECASEAGDALRDVARTFPSQPVQVKLEALSLAKCLALCQTSGGGGGGDEGAQAAADTREVAEYVMSLAKVDSAVEVRDWARFLANTRAPPPPTAMHPPQQQKKNKASAAAMSSLTSAPAVFKKDSEFEIDSLSYAVGSKVAGYQPIPDWPARPREFAIAAADAHSRSEPFASSSSVNKRRPGPLAQPTFSSSSSSSSSSSGSSDEEEDSSEEQSSEETATSSEEEEEEVPAAQLPPAAPMAAAVVAAAPSLPPPPLPPVEFKPLLSSVRGQGLQVEHFFTRGQSFSPPGFTTVQLKITNKHVDQAFSNIRIERTHQVRPLHSRNNNTSGDDCLIAALPVAFFRDDVMVDVDFQGGRAGAVKLTLHSEETGKIGFELKAPVGELLLPLQGQQDAALFDTKGGAEFARMQRQLAGMNESTAKIPRTGALQLPVGEVVQAVVRAGNFSVLAQFDATAAATGTSSSSSMNLLDLDSMMTATTTTAESYARFAARRNDASAAAPQGSLVLAEVKWRSGGGDGDFNVRVNCEYALAAQPLLDAIQASLVHQLSAAATAQ